MLTFVIGKTHRARCLRPVCQPETGQRHAGEADAEFLQRGAARDRLGHILGEFIESIIHTFPFIVVLLIRLSDAVNLRAQG